jgi:hypothetical protein
MAYPVLEISDWPGESDEDLGARNKLWVSAMSGEDSEALWKEGRPGDKVTEPKADLWAEKIGAEIAALMGIPAPRVDLALRDGVSGVLSARIPGTLTHGNQLLSSLHVGYQVNTKGRVEGYDLPSIRRRSVLSTAPRACWCWMRCRQHRSPPRELGGHRRDASLGAELRPRGVVGVQRQQVSAGATAGVRRRRQIASLPWPSHARRIG